jgi:hypothetical protein
MVLATEAVVFVSAAWCLRDKMAPAKWARWLAPCLLAAFAGLGLQKLLAPLVHPALSAPACLGLCVLILSVTDVVDKRDWKKLLPWI